MKQHYNSRGYEICGQLNQHSKPCQRIGSCPFHKKGSDTEVEPISSNTTKPTKEKPSPKEPPVKRGIYFSATLFLCIHFTYINIRSL